MALGPQVGALNRGVEAIELREQDYWKQTLKVSYTLHLLPAKYSTWGFHTHSLTRNFRINVHCTNCPFPKRTEALKGPCPRPQNQLLWDWMSPQVSLTANGLPLSHIKSSTSVARRATQSCLSSCLCHHTDFFLFCCQILVKLLLMMSASSTWPYGNFMATFPFWASNTQGETVLFSDSNIVLAGDGFSHLQGSWFGTKEKEKS